jgi:hypothetical protein
MVARTFSVLVIGFLVSLATSSFADPVPFTVVKKDGVPVAKSRRAPASHVGISKRKGVQLTAKQATFVKSLGQYLKSEGESALVTSGARSPQHQLAIIKSKVREVGASRRFPELKRAAVSKPSTWVRAWQYLRALHVPVYAPKEVPGVYSEISNHTKGLAVDLISSSLDHLHNLVSDFKQSAFAAMSPLRIVSIAREAGCVHINLANK